MCHDEKGSHVPPLSAKKPHPPTCNRLDTPISSARQPQPPHTHNSSMGFKKVTHCEEADRLQEEPMLPGLLVTHESLIKCGWWRGTRRAPLSPRFPLLSRSEDPPGPSLVRRGRYILRAASPSGGLLRWRPNIPNGNLGSDRDGGRHTVQ
ncbi:hypothetical protein, unlikely [Trypanosoma congolense IL3000]|uniref:Uncharacterized protein n=1 Tax=Trypanosoma congolense (strain IL3000) TaxID=1068625 RepID=F9WBP2_TRYCI|nr:hypothetical protein, unlikely [Trypanosoma congolense IL3000]